MDPSRASPSHAARRSAASPDGDRPRVAEGCRAAAAVVVGSLLAARAGTLPVGGLVALAFLSLSLGRAWSRVLAWVVLGALWAGVSWLEPAGTPPEVDEQAVSVVVDREGEWRRGEIGWSSRARVRSARRRGAVSLDRLRVWLEWPHAEPPPAATRLRVRGAFRRSSRFGNDVYERAPSLSLSIRSPLLMEPLLEREEREVAGRFRRRIRRRIDEKLPAAGAGGGPGASLLGALLLGDAQRLSTEMRSGLRRHGLAHLTAASGLHVGTLVGAALLLTAYSPRATRAVAALAGALLLVAIVGGRASLLRAVLMVAGLLMARLVGRRGSLLEALGMAAVVLWAVAPELVVDLGGQLSFAACLGIGLLTRPISERMYGLPSWLRISLAVSVAAQLYTLPLIVSRFSIVSPVAPLLNLVLVPWTALILVLAVCWIFASALFPALDGLGGWFEALVWPFEVVGRIPPHPVVTLPVSADLLPLVVGVAAVSYWLVVGGRVRPLVLGLLLSSAAPSPERVSSVAFLDVGQGDAILMVGKERTMLVDGGGFRHGDIGSRVLVPALARLGVRRLDVVVASHADHDHCGGLVDLQRWMAITEVWVGTGIERGSCGRELVTVGGRRVRRVRAGERRRVGGWTVDVIGPTSVPRSTNGSSLVLRIEHGPHRLLLTGDLDGAGERRLLGGGRDLEADVLKVAHHGSRTSTSLEFLAEVHPSLAVISAGRRNPHGHPTTEVLSRIRRSGVTLFRTDDSGRVLIELPASGPRRVSTVWVRGNMPE